MKEEPDIIKELREAEKNGKLKCQMEDQTFEEIEEEEEDEELDFSIQVVEKKMEDQTNIDFDGLKDGYKKIFENYFIGITIADEKERIIAWNKYAEKILKMNEKDLFLRNVKTLYPTKQWEKIRSENIRQKGMKHKLETKIIKGNGKTFDAEISLSVLRGKEGKIIGSVGIIQDITKLKSADEVLKAYEKKYKKLFETAIDPIIILDDKGCFLDVNEQVTNLLGYSKVDLIGKKFDKVNIFDEDSVAKTSDNFINNKKNEDVTCFEIKAISKNGEVIPAEINASHILEDNKFVGDLIIVRDLRDRLIRENAEKNFLQSEQKFKEIFDSTGDFLMYLEKGIILDANNAALNIFESAKPELIGTLFSSLNSKFLEYKNESIQEFIEKIKNGEEIKDYECEIVKNDGTQYIFSFSSDLIRDDEQVKGLLLRGTEITQRQKAWDELVKLEEKYRILAETSADGVITIDPLGRITYINPSFEKMCDRRKSQILATLFRDYLSEDSVYFFQQVFIDSRKKDEKVENIELELVHADGTVIPIEVNMAPLKKDTEFVGMVCTIRNITERRKIEDELKKSERLKTEFMNIAAHELKSPVTPIKGYLDLIISDKKASKQIKDWAKISLRNSERLLRIVNDILDVSRLDTDTMRFDMEKLNPVEILNEIAEDMRATIERKGLEFVLSIPNSLPNIMGDRYRLSQVLKNLMVNAIKFTDSGSIALLAKQEGNYIIISVQDSGIGISKDELKKIFTKFYQAYTGDDRKNEGTGLGLFICKEIIQKHDGEIWAESEIKEGSTFTLKIPYIHKMVFDLKE